MVNFFIISSLNAARADSRATSVIARRSVFFGFIGTLELIVLVGDALFSTLSLSARSGVPESAHLFCPCSLCYFLLVFIVASLSSLLALAI